MRYRFITIFDSTWKWYMKVLLTQSWTWFCVLTTLFKVLLLYLHTVTHMHLVHLAWDLSIRQYCFESLCSSNLSDKLQVFDFWRIYQLLVFSHLVITEGCFVQWLAEKYIMYCTGHLTQNNIKAPDAYSFSKSEICRMIDTTCVALVLHHVYWSCSLRILVIVPWSYWTSKVIVLGFIRVELLGMN